MPQTSKTLHMPTRAQAALLASFRKQLKEWGPLLQRFLRSEDDQVRGGPRVGAGFSSLL